MTHSCPPPAKLKSSFWIVSWMKKNPLLKQRLFFTITAERQVGMGAYWLYWVYLYARIGSFSIVPKSLSWKSNPTLGQDLLPGLKRDWVPILSDISLRYSYKSGSLLFGQSEQCESSAKRARSVIWGCFSSKDIYQNTGTGEEESTADTINQ